MAVFIQKTFRRFFYAENLVKPDLIRGELPSSSAAYKRCITMAWPAAMESVLVALMGLADIVMVATLGARAISAVGITSQPRFLLMAPLISLNIGVTAMVARLKGERDIEGCRRTMKTAIMASSILSLLISATGILCARPLLLLAGAQPEFIEDSVRYFQIVVVGQFFGCIGMTINAAQRGVGNTKIAMRTNVTANLVNIVFNYFLINGIWIFPRLEVRGAAVATALGSFVSFVISVIYALNKNNELTIIRGEGVRFDRRVVRGIAKIGSSALVEQVFMRIGFFTFAAIIARLGTLAFATHEICMNVILISFAFADGFAVAATSLVGQSLGEKRPDIAMISARVCQRCILLISIVLSVLFIIFRHELILLFSDEPEIIELGAKIMFIIAATCFAQTSQVVISGSLRGAGDAKFVAISSFIAVTFIRPMFSWVLCYPLGLGLIGAWLGLFSDQFIRLALNFWRFASGKWTQISL